MAAPGAQLVGIGEWVVAARAHVAALLAAGSSPPDAVQQVLVELEELVCTVEVQGNPTEEQRNVLRAPGLMAAAVAAARNAPGNPHIWGATCSLLAAMCVDEQDGPQHLNEARALGAPAFALECVQRFSGDGKAVIRGLCALSALVPSEQAHLCCGLPETMLSALEAFPDDSAIVANAARLLYHTAAHNDETDMLISARGRAVTGALDAAAAWDPGTKKSACHWGVKALMAAMHKCGDMSPAAEAARRALVTPGAVRATLAVLQDSQTDAQLVDRCAVVLHYAHGVEATQPGIVAALVNTLKALPDSAKVRSAVCHVFRVLLASSTQDLYDSMGAEARGAGGLLPLAQALRACVADAAVCAQDVDALLFVAGAAACARPPGNDDSDIDEALRAGAAVAAMALTRRHAHHDKLVRSSCMFIASLATSPARCAAIVAVGGCKTAALAISAGMRDDSEFSEVLLRGLYLAAAVTFDCESGAAAGGEAGLVELATRALTAYGVASHEVASACAGVLRNLCKDVPANQARAAAAGAPAALTAALRVQERGREENAGDILRGLWCTLPRSAATAAAEAVPAIVDAMLKFPDDEFVQSAVGFCFAEAMKRLSREERREVMREVQQPLAAALEAGVRRHCESLRVLTAIAVTTVCLCDGGFGIPRVFDALAEALHPGVAEDVMRIACACIVRAMMQSRGAGVRLAHAQLVTALQAAQRRDFKLAESAVGPLLLISAHVDIDPHVAASPLAEHAMAAAAVAAAATRDAQGSAVIRYAAAALLEAAVGHGGATAAAAVAAAHRAGLKPLLESRGALLEPNGFFYGKDLEKARPALLSLLRAPQPAAPVDPDGDACGCGGADAACERCMRLRAQGKSCGLLGCGLARRADDPGRAMARCARCRRAAYCCSAHQKDDWARHKAECRAPAAAQAANATADETEL